MQLVSKEVLEPPLPEKGPIFCSCLAQLDKLVTSQLGFLAQRRLARGVKLNHAEATVSLELG